MARVAFIQHLFFPFLGTMTLSAVLKAGGHSVEVFIDPGGSPKEWAARVAGWRPDLIAFSSTTGPHVEAIRMARFLRQACPRARTIMGGPHPTFFPEVIEEDVLDMICIGEGEGALLDLCRAIDTKTESAHIPNLHIKQGKNSIIRNDLRPLIEDLDSLPFADQELYFSRYPMLRRSAMPIFTGRGCPFNCTYCFNHTLRKMYAGKGTYVRKRSPENVVAEIEAGCAGHGFRRVYFQDDTFSFDRPWLRKFLVCYRDRVRLPFFCLATAESLDEETVGMLARSGCSSIFFGIETGNEARRQKILRKPVSDQAIRGAARLLKAAKITFRTYNMLGLPEETLEMAWQTVQLNVEIRTDHPWCSLFQPFPRTELAEMAARGGLLSADPAHLDLGSFFRSSVLHSGCRREVENLQKLFFWAVRYPVLIPLIKRLIRLPANLFFDLAFLGGYAISYMGSETMTGRELFRMALGNLRRTYFRGEGKDSAA